MWKGPLVGLALVAMLAGDALPSVAADPPGEMRDGETKVLVPPFENLSKAKPMIDYEVGTVWQARELDSRTGILNRKTDLINYNISKPTSVPFNQ